MDEKELVEIERRFQSRIGTDKFLTIFDRDMKDLIAEVRRLKTENRAMQSRLDIAEGRVDGMKAESGSISVQRLRQLHENAGGIYDTNFGL